MKQVLMELTGAPDADLGWLAGLHDEVRGLEFDAGLEEGAEAGGVRVVLLVGVEGDVARDGGGGCFGAEAHAVGSSLAAVGGGCLARVPRPACPRGSHRSGGQHPSTRCVDGTRLALDRRYCRSTGD